MPTTAPGIITVREVSRVFRSAKKEEGMKGALRLLVRPTYTQHVALDQVSFSIEPGSFNGLIGANGAGKTTLLKILSGLIPPSSGEARVMGFDPFRRSLEFRRNISLVMGQKAQLWWDLPALDAFDLIRAIYEIPLPAYRERLHTLSELLDVEGHLHTQIRRLSLGERMKMELIGALLHWPKVIFLDEPTIGLDVLAAHRLREFLREFNTQQKATIVLTSHNMDDIERLCSRVLILRSGRLIYDGGPRGLIQEGARQLRVRLFEQPDVQALASSAQLNPENIEVDPEDSGTLRISLKKDQIAPVLQALMKSHTIADMGIEEESLETVIQRLYGEDRTRRL